MKLTSFDQAGAKPNGIGHERLLVRAAAELRSQGRRTLVPWEARSPLGAHESALCQGNIMRETPWKTARGVTPRECRHFGVEEIEVKAPISG